MKVLKYITLFCLLMSFGAFAQKVNVKENIYYCVVKVRDGDTVVLLVDNQELPVRLSHIDTPEKKQAFGTKAKQFTSNLCFGKRVRISGKQKYDRYNRLLAEIINENGININKELVKNGLAWHYKRYSNSVEYSRLENEARRKRINIWSDREPLAPWDYRKLRRKKL